MRKRILLLASAILVGFGTWALWPDNEPTYNGRSLSYWILARGNRFPSPPGSPASLQREEAGKAIRHIGTNALPYLLKWLPYQTPRPLKALERAVWTGGLSVSPFRRLPYFKNEVRATCAFDAFLVLANDGAAAIPDLARLANDTGNPVVAERARQCLWALLLEAAKADKKPEDCPLLIAALNDTNTTVRTVAADVRDVIHAATSIRFSPPSWERNPADSPPQTPLAP